MHQQKKKKQPEPKPETLSEPKSEFTHGFWIIPKPEKYNNKTSASRLDNWPFNKLRTQTTATFFQFISRSFALERTIYYFHISYDRILILMRNKNVSTAANEVNTINYAK